MKKLFAYLSTITLLFSGSVLAQNQNPLPPAGLTPESPFYFLDKFGETLREFFSFNPEGKARLQVTFAAERISEIKVILETKGVKARGLDVAKLRLVANIQRAVTLLDDLKSSGEDTKSLAKEINDGFSGNDDALEQVFDEREDVLELQEDEIKAKIREARRSGDTAQVEALIRELAEVKTQQELLELKEEELEDVLEEEEERLEEELEAKEEAEEKIRKAEEEKQEVLDEAAEEGVAIPAHAFDRFDGLLSQAKAAFDAENFKEAKRLAKSAKKSLDEVEDAVDKLEKALEEEEELKEEREEADEKGVERLEKEIEKAKEEVRKAENRVEEAGNEDKD